MTPGQWFKLLLTPGQWFKLLCVVAYAAIVSAATIVGHWYRGEGPHVEAARAISENQIIADADVRAVGQKEISGHSALRGFAIGEKITPRNVSAPSVPPFENAVAAVITMRRAGSVGGIEKGTSVQVCLDHKPFGKPSKVAMAICGDKNCLVTIPLSEWPKDTKGTKDAEEVRDTKPPKRAKGTKGAKPAVAATGTQSKKDTDQRKETALPVDASRLSAVPDGEKCDSG
jgi:hypothetical protein